MKDKLLIGLSPLLIHNATQKWKKPSKIMILLKILFFHLTGISKLNRQLLP